MMLWIITPLTRVENLKRVMASITRHYQRFNIEWVVVIDGSIDYKKQEVVDIINGNGVVMVSPIKHAIGGHAHRNWALDLLPIRPKDFIYMLDDDNLLHPELPKAINSITNHDVVMFHQRVKRKYIPILTRVRKISPENVRIARMDIAQMAFRRKSMDGMRFREDIYEADGLFAEELKYRNRVLYIDKVLCYYNWV